ncbi:MAG: hypothetical protein ACJ71U_23280 [Terriglobales bacterium]
MRAIDPIRLQTAIAAAWVQKANEKANELKKLHDRLISSQGDLEETWQQISDAVKALAKDIWQDKQLKEVFMSASFGKCWYCEAKVAQRADNAIDHFRPKNRVAEAKTTHHGYWWLACDWHNYRFACTFCNSARSTPDSTGGKQDHFPLWDETKRVRLPDDLLGGEQPLLLDPLQAADMSYLTFDSTGKPAARHSKEQNPYKYSRAAASIRCYHLDRSELNMDRGNLMASMEEKLRGAEEFARDLGGENPTAETAYKQIVAALAEYIRPDAEFSSATRAFLQSKRGTYSVARELLETPL